MITRGSQRRETIEEAGYRLVSTWPEVSLGCVVLEDETGKRELWTQNDCYSGYVITINNIGYEFLRTVKE